MKTCSSDQNPCEDGSGCVHNDYWCDYTADCKDGSDEKNCPEEICNGDRWKCHTRRRDNTTQCIPMEWVCDEFKKKDCHDGSDEFDCHANDTAHDVPEPAITTIPSSTATTNWSTISNNYSFVLTSSASDQADMESKAFFGLPINHWFIMIGALGVFLLSVIVLLIVVRKIRKKNRRPIGGKRPKLINDSSTPSSVLKSNVEETGEPYPYSTIQEPVYEEIDEYIANNCGLVAASPYLSPVETPSADTTLCTDETCYEKPSRSFSRENVYLALGRNMTPVTSDGYEFPIDSKQKSELLKMKSSIEDQMWRNSGPYDQCMIATDKTEPLCETSYKSMNDNACLYDDNSFPVQEENKLYAEARLGIGENLINNIDQCANINCSEVKKTELSSSMLDNNISKNIEEYLTPMNQVQHVNNQCRDDIISVGDQDNSSSGYLEMSGTRGTCRGQHQCNYITPIDRREISDNGTFVGETRELNTQHKDYLRMSYTRDMNTQQNDYLTPFEKAKSE